MKTLSDRLRIARRKHGFTQWQVARFAGMTQCTYWRLECGNTLDEHIVKRLVKMAELLECDPEWLILGKGKCAD